MFNVERRRRLASIPHNALQFLRPGGYRWIIVQAHCGEDDEPYMRRAAEGGWGEYPLVDGAGDRAARWELPLFGAASALGDDGGGGRTEPEAEGGTEPCCRYAALNAAHEGLGGRAAERGGWTQTDRDRGARTTWAGHAARSRCWISRVAAASFALYSVAGGLS